MKSACLVLLSALLCAGSAGKAENRSIDLQPQWDTVRVLKNPEKGWYHHLLDNGVNSYAIRDEAVFRTFPGMDHLYLRLAWSYLEPQEGHYDWHRIDEVVERYVPLGYKIAFRITSKETGIYPGSVGQEEEGVQYATPAWVRRAGAKGTVFGGGRVKSWIPVWDDPVYLEKLSHFQQAFAARYDGQPWVRYVDVGSIGEWGEGHTSFSTKVPPTVAEVKANIDIFIRHFKKTQVVCTDDLIYYGKSGAEVKALYDYAVAKGASLRDDSPLVAWYLQQNLKTWSVSHPQFYDPLYLKKPIIFELEHYRSVKKDGNWLGTNGTGTIPRHGVSGAEVMRQAIQTMHATYIGYHGYAEEWLAENPELSKELANRCGYWYFPLCVSVPPRLSAGINRIGIHWLNKGVAPAYKPFQIALRLVDARNQLVCDLGTLDSGNLSWLPDKVVEESYPVRVPEEVKKGEYLLKIKLFLRGEKVPELVALGLKAELTDAEGFSTLGDVQVNE